MLRKTQAAIPQAWGFDLRPEEVNLHATSELVREGKRLRVAMVTDLYPPFLGGLAESVYQLSTQLVALGHEVFVFTCDRFQNRRASRQESVDGVAVRRIKPLVPFQTLYSHLMNPITLVKALKQVRPDIIHLHGTGSLENDYVALSMGADTPVVMTGHGGGMFQRPGRPWYHHLGWRLYRNLIQERSARRLAALVACSPFEVPSWQKLGIDRNSIFVVPWGIPEDCFQESSGREFREDLGLRGFVLLFVGSLVPGKGAQWLIEALPRVLHEVPQVTAVLCGPDFGYGEYLRTVVRRHSLEDNVVFAGYLPREKLVQAFAACDVFILPSDIEAFGLALAEAMGSGKPVVASNVGSIPFIVEDGRSGFLVPPRDPASLSDRVLRLLRDEHLRKAFGERGRVLAQQYRWERTGRLYEGVYRYALGDLEETGQDTR